MADGTGKQAGKAVSKTRETTITDMQQGQVNTSTLTCAS